MSLARFKARLAELRQKGHGVWHIIFIVLGFDEEFEMHAPGNLSETFAVARTRLELAKELKVKLHNVIHQRSTHEGP